MATLVKLSLILTAADPYCYVNCLMSAYVLVYVNDLLLIGPDSKAV
jgi:hypothetical protein